MSRTPGVFIKREKEKKVTFVLLMLPKLYCPHILQFLTSFHTWMYTKHKQNYLHYSIIVIILLDVYVIILLELIRHRWWLHKWQNFNCFLFYLWQHWPQFFPREALTFECGVQTGQINHLLVIKCNKLFPQKIEKLWLQLN